MNRIVKKEILDSLPSDDPAVAHARRDLLLINTLMGNQRWILRGLRRLIRADEHLLEIGSGDGRLAARIDRLTTKDRPFHPAALDRTPRPDKLPDTCLWHQGDIFENLDLIEGADLLVANLTLHHFTPFQLDRIGRSIARGPRVVLACETVRRRAHLGQILALRLMRLHPVTQHDAPISIEAGFRADELPTHLNLDPTRWSISVTETLFGAYRLLAIRR